jgi:hypothetical protein
MPLTSTELRLSVDAKVPRNIPRPIDDGLASRLLGSTVPTSQSIDSAKSETSVKLSELPDLTIIFCYPRLRHLEKMFLIRRPRNAWTYLTTC